MYQKEEENAYEQKAKSIENLPKEDFSEADFIVYWKKYIDILNKQKSSMLASILNSSVPEFIDKTTVKITYPNSMMMSEVKKNEIAILNYLREKLKNYDLKFSLHYNEDQEKEFVYTPQEKFEKLAQLNPNLIEFRKRFNLDF